jgi:hypothetical protein
MIHVSEDEFEQMIAWRDRVGREANASKASRSELWDVYQRMEILLREIKERTPALQEIQR